MTDYNSNVITKNNMSESGTRVARAFTKQCETRARARARAADYVSAQRAFEGSLGFRGVAAAPPLAAPPLSCAASAFAGGWGTSDPRSRRSFRLRSSYRL